MVESRPLRVFLCHASQDKPKVRELYKRLKTEVWIEPWLDEEDLLPGQDFDVEIYNAIRAADLIIICLSTVSVAKDGYVNKEIRRALDIAQEKNEGAIYVIPLRLDDCNPSFEQLRKLHWVDYFMPNAHDRLLKSLRVRATALTDLSSVDLDLFRFIQIPQTSEVPYSFWIGKYPITNAQYERFLNAPDYATESLWRGFLEFNEDCIQIGRWGSKGSDWLKEKMGESHKPPLPLYWEDEEFGLSNPDNPVVGVTWYEANAYCNWLARHWNELAESRANSKLRPHVIRLPLDTEWTAAAGGEILRSGYPWEARSTGLAHVAEIILRANVAESNIVHTTPVNAYLRGASSYGVMDMAGNVWEWQANYEDMEQGWLSLRGGSWTNDAGEACVSSRYYELPEEGQDYYGFRVIVLPSG